MKVFLFVLIFFILGALLIISNNNLALYDSSNVGIFLNLYSAWLDDIFSNSFNLVGKVVELDWLPK